MLVERLTIYESWDLDKPSIPSRSRLYQVEPVGIGTPLVESLTGYIARLAETHCVLPGVLMERELAPFIKEVPDPGSKCSRTGVFGHTGTLNGVGVMAMDWVRALETLTLRNDLRFLTMLTWAEVFPPKGLLRNNWAYCPACFEEWHSAGQVIYEPLLWAINGVDICPRHHRLLRLKCLHCNQPLFPLAWRSRPGYCSKCGQWLGSKLDAQPPTSEGLTQKQFSRQLWDVIGIGELIAAQVRLSGIPPSERIAKAFSICIEEMTEGNIAAFARLIGKPKNTVWMWQAGKVLPQLSVLVQICHCLGISVLDFLNGDIVAHNLAPETKISHTQMTKVATSPKKNCDLDQLRRTLNAVKNGDEYPPPCMAEVAKRLGYNVRFLRRHFSSHCHAISARYLHYRKALHLKRVEQSCKEVQQAALDIYAQGEEPTRSRVSSRLTKPAYLRDKDVCAALSEVRRQLGLKE